MKLKLSRPKNYQKKHFHFKSSTNLTTPLNFKTSNAVEDDYQLGKIITQKKYYQSLIKKELDELERLQQPQTQAFNNIQDEYGMIKETIKLKNSNKNLNNENINSYRLKNRYADIQTFDSCQNFKSQEEVIQPKTDEQFINCYKILAKFMLEKQFNQFKQKMEQNLIQAKKKKGVKYFNQIRIMKQNFNQFKQNYLECIQQNRLFFQEKISKVRQVLKQSSISSFIYSSNYQNVKKSYQKLKIFKELDQKRRFLLILSQNCKQQSKTLEISHKLTQMKVKLFYKLLKQSKTFQESLRDKQQIVFNIRMHRNFQSFIQLMKAKMILNLFKQYELEQANDDKLQEKISQNDKQQQFKQMQNQKQIQELFPQNLQQISQVKFQRFLQYATTTKKESVALQQQNNNLNNPETNIIYDIYEQQTFILNKIKLNTIQKKYEKQIKADTIKQLHQKYDLYKKNELVNEFVIRNSMQRFIENLEYNKKENIQIQQKHIQNKQKQQKLKSFLKIMSGQYYFAQMIKNQKENIFLKRQEKLQVFLLGEKLQNQQNQQKNKKTSIIENQKQSTFKNYQSNYSQQLNLNDHQKIKVQSNQSNSPITIKNQLKLRAKFYKLLFFQCLSKNKIRRQKQKFSNQIYNKIYQNQLTKRGFTSWKRSLLLLAKQCEQQKESCNELQIQNQDINQNKNKLLPKNQINQQQQSHSFNQNNLFSIIGQNNSKSSVQFLQSQQNRIQQKQNLFTQIENNPLKQGSSDVDFDKQQNIKNIKQQNQSILLNQNQELSSSVQPIEDHIDSQIDNETIITDQTRLIHEILIKNCLKDIMKNYQDNKKYNKLKIENIQRKLFEYGKIKKKKLMLKIIKVLKDEAKINGQKQRILINMMNKMIQYKEKQEKEMLKLTIDNWKLLLLYNNHQQEQQQLSYQVKDQKVKEQQSSQQNINKGEDEGKGNNDDKNQESNQNLNLNENENQNENICLDYMVKKNKQKNKNNNRNKNNLNQSQRQIIQIQQMIEGHNHNENYQKRLFKDDNENEENNKQQQNQNQNQKMDLVNNKKESQSDKQSKQYSQSLSQQLGQQGQNYQTKQQYQEQQQQQIEQNQQMQMEMEDSQDSQNILQNYIQNNKSTNPKSKDNQANQYHEQQELQSQKEKEQFPFIEQNQNQNQNHSSFKQVKNNQVSFQQQYNLYQLQHPLQYENNLNDYQSQYQQQKQQIKLKFQLLGQQYLFKKNQQSFMFVIKDNYLTNHFRKNVQQQFITGLINNLEHKYKKQQTKKLELYVTNKYTQKITKKAFRVFKYELYKVQEQRELQIKQKIFLQFKQYYLQKRLLKKYLIEYQEVNSSIIDKNISYFPKSREDKKQFQNLYHNKKNQLRQFE